MEHLYLEVTTHCNRQCSHCSVRSQTGDGVGSPFGILVEVLEGFRDAGGRYLTLSGGEPGLRPDLPALIDETRRLGLGTTVFTNGRAVSGPILDALARAGGSLALSLDGPTPAVHEALRGYGTFGPAVDALRRAVEVLGAKQVILSCVLSRPLLPEISRMWEFAEREKAGTLYLDIFEPVRQGETHPLAPAPGEIPVPVLQLLDLAENRPGVRLAFSESDDLIHGRSVFSRRPPESALGRTVKLQADGWALPGPFYYEPRFRLGRPIEEGWTTTLASPVLGFLLQEAGRRVKGTLPCSTCFWRERCAGGSLALTWATYGTWDHPCPLCPLYIAALDRAATKELHYASAADT